MGKPKPAFYGVYELGPLFWRKDKKSYLLSSHQSLADAYKHVYKIQKAYEKQWKWPPSMAVKARYTKQYSRRK